VVEGHDAIGSHTQPQLGPQGLPGVVLPVVVLPVVVLPVVVLPVVVLPE
jgi:hypothetical protein